MQNKPISIAVFLLSESMKSGLEKFYALENISITMVDKCLENAIEVGKLLEKQGVEVIIGRRGTASMLRANLNIPVLSFPTSTMSLLISIQNASKMGKRIFLPSYGKEIQRLDFFQQFLEIKIKQEVYFDEGSLNLIVKKADRDGFDVVVGGKATMQASMGTNLHYCELITLENEIDETMESARSVAMSARKERAMTNEYRAIMDAASDAIIAVNDAGQVSSINHAACTLLNFSHDHIGKPITKMLPNQYIAGGIRKKAHITNKVIKLHGFTYLFNLVPILMGTRNIGAVISLREIDQVMKAENTVRRSLARGFTATYTIQDIIYQSPQMSNVVKLTEQFADTHSSVLIMGSTGTGKELIAQSLHNLSGRQDRPFVSVNCGALPEQLLESELFGYDEGAFTGSKKGGKPGLFEIAHHGTIFLDEIDSTNLEVQKRLLRVLQEKEVMRISADKKIPVDVRVIAAAGTDLWSLVQVKQFRKDLFFRLNVLQISIPPLKQRKDDIPLLLNHFIHHYSKKHNTPPVNIADSHLNRLTCYEWPGNIRQLRHFAERLILNLRFIRPEEAFNSLIDELMHIVEDEPVSSYPSASVISVAAPAVPAIRLSPREDSETASIIEALQQSCFNRGNAAKILGISRATLWRRMKALEIKMPI